ncbi:hypothetical protein BKP64_10900 [Marinobacter salinus]|uniref:Peptidase M15A C-terminal domain-containing protein n=1 Tax=Marinobacter salinus TaxID=1874317 RepID=A0A1D9GLW9_9GAMM|nr:hypothetical protein [Marinobacter salinus]AOY88636.1 hypothetical protein BKP64_10900 [Marinobacter salinus]
MLKLKAGVVAQGLSTEIMLAVCVAQSVYASYGHDCVITSLLDGTHSSTSLHYSGNAVDLRTRIFESTSVAESVARDLGDCLGADYDVVLESDHIHVEYQPKR